MRINNSSVASATGAEKERQLKVLNTGRQIQRVVDGVSRAYGLLSQRQVSLLSLATGSWRAEISIDFVGLDAALKDAKELVKLVGPDTTVEISNDDVSIISLQLQVEQVIALVSSTREELDPRRMRA